MKGNRFLMSSIKKWCKVTHFFGYMQIFFDFFYEKAQFSCLLVQKMGLTHKKRRSQSAFNLLRYETLFQFLALLNGSTRYGIDVVYCSLYLGVTQIRLYVSNIS